MGDAIVAPLADGSLYHTEETTRLVLYWCILWVVVHYLAWPLWHRRRVVGLMCSPTPVERYRRRLARSQVYCACAVVGGLRLLLGCRWSAQDLLYAYSAEHQVLFSMAVAHWLVSIWEDLHNWTFLRGGLSAKDTQNGGDPSYFLWQAYLVHHLVAAFAFGCALRMKVCTGLAAFGLIFELPVLYMNHREFIVYAENPVEWFQDIRQVELFWVTLTVWFRLARGGPTLVYLYSLIFWSEDLNRLSTKESWTYHGMAIFFSILNWGLASTFLTAWRKKDMDMAESCATKAKDFEEKFRQLLHPEDEAHVAEKEMKEEEQSIAEDLPEVVKKPLMQVTPELFASKVQGESGELWLEIDNVAYDLTEFIGKHPGGDQILRQFAGKDASKAFHKAKHSMKAKMQMQMYCVGPMMKELKEYRIFEHTNEVRTLSFSFMQVAALLAFACWLLPYSYYPSVRSLQATESFTARLLAPGLAFAAGTSTLLLPGRQRFNPSTWTCGAIYFAVCFTAILVGLELARRPVVTDAWPSGLEIGAVTIFVVEEVALHLGAEGWRYLYWRRIFLAAGLLLLSWNLRGATLDMVDHSPEHVMGGLLLGLGIPAICRLASSQNEVVMEQALQGLALTTFACLPWLLYLLMPEQDGLRTLALHAWANWTVNTLVMAIASSLCALVFVAMVLSEACASKPLASRSVAVMLSVAVGLRSGWSGWRWLAWLSWFALIGTLGQRHIAVLQSLQKSGKLGELPVQRIAVRSAWEMFYLVLGAMIWQVGQGLFKMLINGVMPQELQFYAPWLPFFELGEDVDVGVAAYYAPKEALKSKVGPHHFVCSVRHLDPSHAEGQRDLQLQQNTVRDMWLKCKDTTAGGLVANVNCFFPRLSGSTHCKEINLSGWVSADAADAWKKQHGSLPGGQGPNSRGQMRTMGSMEAILTPHGEIRHQDRCSSCARLSESATLGEKAPERCKFCGKKNFGYPFF